MRRRSRLLVACLAASALLASQPSFAIQTERGQNQSRAVDDVDPNATTDLIKHDIGNVNTTLANFGEYGNPNYQSGFRGMEYPLGSGNDFLFSAGIWVGAIVDGERRVSTATDGDNGTREFWPVHIGAVPLANTNEPDWHVSSRTLQERNGTHYVRGEVGIDDDGDWILDTDDLDSNLVPSSNWDGGGGRIGYDDDDDGLIDEELANGIDDDGDDLIDEDSEDGDANGDGDAGYDPEPHVDEDPPGDMAADHFDNDYDGLVDADDPDHDGDCCPGSFDDDGDGVDDEDAAAHGDQEYYCVYQDSIQPQFVSSPDIDGHTPLDIEVTQRSFAWSDSLFENVILLEYTVRNMSSDALEDVHLAYFADSDIRAQGEPGDAASLDDGTYFDPARRMMVTYDNYQDNDGPGPGVFAVKAIRPPIPWSNALFTYKNFDRGSGGDPETNFGKFEMISAGDIDPPSAFYGDWRMLMGWGSIDGTLSLAPGEIMSFSVAMFAAADTNEVKVIADRLSPVVPVLRVRNRSDVAADFSLHQNFPNPFNPVTTIAFDLSAVSNVHLNVYDVTGRQVAVLLSERLAIGRHSVHFDGAKLASGIYFYALKSERFSDVKKMVLIK